MQQAEIIRCVWGKMRPERAWGNVTSRGRGQCFHFVDHLILTVSLGEAGVMEVVKPFLQMRVREVK